MALKSFGRQTLNDNWYEDRAPPLRNGVLADDGQVELISTQRVTHRNPNKNVGGRAQSRCEKQRKLALEKGGLAITMVQPHSIAECVRERPLMGPNEGSWAVVPKAQESDHLRHLATTQQEGYGIPSRQLKTADRALRAPSAPFAGTAKTHRPSRGLQATGAIGEVFKAGEDPQANTAAQRAWLAYNDPLIQYKAEGVPRARMPLGASLNIGEKESWNKKGTNNNQNNQDDLHSFGSPGNNSKTRSITMHADQTSSTLRMGKHIYMDDDDNA
mmetsp:Transcript_23978/g.41794  ORF Transcript_23978/g.41794 Transcript_23978/m.41794 type:complete len:272 (+) Transcript_23978:50-865(+)